jgi:hypothetical protein
VRRLIESEVDASFRVKVEQRLKGSGIGSIVHTLR